ncbi:MAG: PepSY domain-containing protein [Deferribacteraceae bacterium]|nr:PepSY domain-containing protein [Deferribacteraceae bacterium]
MKRILITTLTIMSLLAIGAFAQGFGGYGRGGGYGGGYGGGWGHGMGMMGGGPCWGGGWGANGGYNGGEAIKSESDAKAIVQDLINDNLKGYKIGDVMTVNGYNGYSMYFVYATDNSGNAFTFVTTPFGGVRGPIPGRITPPTY